MLLTTLWQFISESEGFGKPPANLPMSVRGYWKPLTIPLEDFDNFANSIYLSELPIASNTLWRNWQRVLDYFWGQLREGCPINIQRGKLFQYL
jgi:hypothetical protein